MTGHAPERWTAAGAVLAGLAVAAGAFGAHLLLEILTEPQLATFDTAAQYQMYHALALTLAGHRMSHRPSFLLHWACRFFLMGIILFSGSLYALAFTGARGFGAITPVGGVALLAGWLCFAGSALRRSS